MKIAIIGAGAMGSRFGYMLQHSGNDVFLVDTWKEHVDTINKNGLLVEENSKLNSIKIPAFLPEEVVEIPELIILFTKSMGLKPMLKSINKIIGKNTQVLCLLNGLGHSETISEFVDIKNIFMGVTLWTSELICPGHVKLTGSGNLEIQNLDPTMGVTAKKICQTLNDANLNAIYSKNVVLSIWKKACINGALNSTCTILDCNIEEFGQLKNSKKIITKIIQEFSQIASKYNIPLNIDEIVKNVEQTYDPNEAGEHFPSMHQDLIQNHRLTEIDYINGYISKKGKEFDIPTPYNNLLTILVHSKEELLIK